MVRLIDRFMGLPDEDDWKSGECSNPGAAKQPRLNIPKRLLQNHLKTHVGDLPSATLAAMR